MASLRTFLGLALLLGVGSTGCRGCKNDHPYTPPEADASAPPAPVATTTGASARPDGGRAEPAFLAPTGATKWTLEGVTLEAGGKEIVQALVGDFDGDGTRDALAIVRSTDHHAGPSGELLFFPGTKAAPTTIAVGPAAGVQPSCVPVARLERIGPRTAFAEIGSACTKGPASRGAIVVRLAAPGPAVAFDAVIVDPPLAAKLVLDIDATDRDRDGSDDVVLHVALEGVDAQPRLGASLAFFDRSAGPSRDPEEPEASLKAIAAQAVSKAKTKDAKTVPPLVAQLRALYRAMCQEGGAPRLTSIHGGGATSCGASKALEDAGVAEVRAWISLHDTLRAFVAADQAQGAPATKTASQTSTIAKMLSELAPTTDAHVHFLTTLPDPTHEGRPEWSPLAFESSGALLVRNAGKVVRVDPVSYAEEAVDVPAWKDDVLGPDGKLRWVEAYHACEGATLRATFAGEADMIDVPLPVPPRLGKTCSWRGAEAHGDPATAVPVAWTTRGLEALVAGELLLVQPEPGSTPGATALGAFLDEPAPPGSPLSPNGKNFAIASKNGVLVHRDKWALVRSGELEPYADTQRCVISDDGHGLACVRRRKAVLATLP